jgi:hypothetical protein
MMSTSIAGRAFHKGDEVILASGTYQGTSGVFLGLREDPVWADITQRDGIVHSHPVAWLAHSTIAFPLGTP